MENKLTKALIAVAFKVSVLKIDDDFITRLNKHGIFSFAELKNHLKEFKNVFSSAEIKNVFLKCPDFFLQNFATYSNESKKIAKILKIDGAFTIKHFALENPLIFAYGEKFFIQTCQRLKINPQHDVYKTIRNDPKFYTTEIQLEDVSDKVNISVKTASKELTKAVTEFPAIKVEEKTKLLLSFRFPKNPAFVFKKSDVEAILKQPAARNFVAADPRTALENLIGLANAQAKVSQIVSKPRLLSVPGKTIELKYDIIKSELPNFTQTDFFDAAYSIPSEDLIYARLQHLKLIKEFSRENYQQDEINPKALKVDEASFVKKYLTEQICSIFYPNEELIFGRSDKSLQHIYPLTKKVLKEKFGFEREID